MYGKLYFKIYTYLQSKGKEDPKFDASIIILITQGIHLTLILSIIKYFTGLRLYDNLPLGRYTLFPFGTIWLICIFYFFKNKEEIYKIKYSELKSSDTKQFIITILLVILVPFIIAVGFSGGEIGGIKW